MIGSLPPPVMVTELVDGIRYRLPLRKRGGFVWLGLGHLVSGLVGIPFIAFWLYAVGYHVNWQAPLDGPEGFLLIFLALGLFMLGGILWVTSQGITRLVGHSEIEVRGETLRSFECWGPLRVGWRRPLARLARFEVCHANLEKEAIKAYDSASAAVDYHVILPVWETDEGLPRADWKRLAWGYPRDWLVPLANELARRCRLAALDVSPALATAPLVPVTTEPLPNEAGFVEQFAQPPGGKWVVGRSEGQLHLTLPGKLELRLEEDVLHVEVRKALRTRQHTWSRDQLAEIRVSKDVDHEGPDTPVLLIRPHPGEGDLVRVALASEAEARWLATLLRHSLELEDRDWQKAGGPFRERSEPPAGHSIVVQRPRRALTLTVPTVGILHRANRNHYLSALIMALVAGAVGVILVFAPNNAFFQFFGGASLWGWVFGCTVLLTFVFLMHAVYVSQQTMQLQVVGDSLRVERHTLLGTTQQQWLRLRIADVRVGYHLSRLVPRQFRQSLYDSGRLNWELQIHLEHGEPVGLLEDYPAQELQWVATLLRRELGLPRVPGQDRG